MAKALREAKAKAPKMVADAPKETSGLEAAEAAQGQDAPSSGAATGTDTREQSDQGGAGDPAGSARDKSAEDLRQLEAAARLKAEADAKAEAEAEAEALAEAAARLKAEADAKAEAEAEAEALALAEAAAKGNARLDDALDALAGQGEHLDTEAEFRSRFPRMSAALNAWKAEHGDELPSGLRIRSKLDGFRRAGIPHSKAPVEHQLGAFKGPEQLEAIFAEPNLVVELI
ncbi:HI1506-related protein [Mesorhizobium sp. M0050]|uniref:HI1506-related protein n=1 Tax=unclassified Mesorhizobium TaxID=325217 RepID=UPI00333AB6CA